MSPMPSALPPDSAEYRLRRIRGERIVELMILLTLAGTLLYGLSLFLFDLVKGERLIATSLLLIASLASLILLHRNKVAAAFQILVLGTWLAITATAVQVSGVRSGVVFIYPVVVMACWPLGRRAVVTAGLASILAVAGLGTSEHLGLFVPPFLPPPILLSLKIGRAHV